jgi:hypothetical protein
VEGLTSEAVAEAHKKDLEVQDKHGVRCLHYWYNENQGTVFCLLRLRVQKRQTPCTRKPMALRLMR